MEQPSSKEYIGDAVYAEASDHDIRLTTENGISVSNEIFIDLHMLGAIVRYAERHFGFKATK